MICPSALVHDSEGRKPFAAHDPPEPLNSSNVKALFHSFGWAASKQDLKALQQVVIEDQGKALSLRTECVGTCGKVFQAVWVAIPATIQEL